SVVARLKVVILRPLEGVMTSGRLPSRPIRDTLFSIVVAFLLCCIKWCGVAAMAVLLHVLTFGDLPCMLLPRGCLQLRSLIECLAVPPPVVGIPLGGVDDRTLSEADREGQRRDRVAPRPVVPPASLGERPVVHVEALSVF